MTLVSLQSVSVAFGGPPVLEDARLSLERGERISVLGRNGAGKSTLLRILGGELLPDSGTVVRQGGVSVAALEQAVPEDLIGSFFDVVASGLGKPGEVLAAYHTASQRVAADHSDAAMSALDHWQRQIDALDAWQWNHRVEVVLQQFGLNPESLVEEASGGQKRQLLFARALVARPDVLLLDEPTNHLDIEAIERMEAFLLAEQPALIFVTHDRAFLRRIATRVVELDRGQLMDYGPDYDGYLERKAAMLHAESKAWEDFDRRLAQEEVWIRTGIQARRTRNEGRVRALEALRVERAARRDRSGVARAQLQESDRSGRLVIEVRDLGFSYGASPVVKDFSTTIMRGDRVGFIGPNGSGKTTLIRLLLGELQPDAGTVRLGTNLDVAYFDQLREQLDPEQTVFDSIADGNEWVELSGGRRHVYSYLDDFLFSRDRARSPVAALSGGERNRLLLARLFTRRFNVLVLDEPTNDLDLEMLEVLEGLLLAFEGTLLLVSHDRAFLDAVVTSTLVFEGQGRVAEYVGGYSDWVRQRSASVLAGAQAGARAGDSAASAAGPGSVSSAAATRQAQAASRKRERRLSYKEKIELESLPGRIETAEGERDACYLKLSDPQLLRDGTAVVEVQAKLAALEAAITELMARWEELESIAQ